MRKIVALVLTLMFVLAVVGCTQQTTSQKTEEELKAEIRAEMEAEQKLKEVAGPANIAILNYDGEGLERLEQIEIDCNDNAFNHHFKIGATDRIALFGEVKDVKIGFAQWFTEGNYMPIKEFESLKDTELVIHRSAAAEEMFIVSFFDGGMREHTYHLMTDECFVSEDPDEQQLVAKIEEKDKLPSSYDDAAELFIDYIGMTEDEFNNSNHFANVEIEYGAMEGEPYFHIENEPLGYHVTLSVSPYGEPVIDSIRIEPNDAYTNIKDSAKKSFFGVDFDMSIYGARYNLNNTRDDIQVSFDEKYDESMDDYTDTLGSINIFKK